MNQNINENIEPQVPHENQHENALEHGVQLNEVPVVEPDTSLESSGQLNNFDQMDHPVN